MSTTPFAQSLPSPPRTRWAGAKALVFGFFTLFGTLGPGLAQQVIGQHTLDPLTKSEIEIVSLFDGIPQSGFLPITIRMANGYPRDLNLKINFDVESNGSRFNSEHAFVATRLKETREAFLVPVPTCFSSSGFMNHVDFTAHVAIVGLPGITLSQSLNRPDPQWPMIAMSRDLATANIKALESRVETELSLRNSPFALQFTAGKQGLPTDWLGLSGFDALLISFAEWEKTPAASRNAINDWIKLGGELHVHSRRSGITAATLGLTGDPDGSVQFHSWSGKEVDQNRLFSHFRKIANKETNLGKQLQSGYMSGGWPLQQKLGIRSFNAGLVLIVLLAFAILVGPINLFVFAPSGKRHRLFLTTPLISIATSLLIAGLIIAQDRFGGNGARLAIVNLDPAGKNAYTVQEQFSRTGVLLNSRFERPDPIFISHVALPRSQWTRVHDSDNNLIQSLLSTSPPSLRGDWFFSRSEQGHYIKAVIPTRARIERLSQEAPNGAPTLFSNLGFPLEELFYRDEAGNWWQSASVIPTGQPATLQPAADFQTRKGEMAAEASSNLESKLDQLEIPPGHFFGLGQASDWFIPTLSSVRWDADRLFIHGPVETALITP
ncbi:MAG: hypothetical protein AAF514_08260 [Verrucomicrobiota bacterium]